MILCKVCDKEIFYDEFDECAKCHNSHYMCDKSSWESYEDIIDGKYFLIDITRGSGKTRFWFKSIFNKKIISNFIFLDINFKLIDKLTNIIN